MKFKGIEKKQPTGRVYGCRNNGELPVRGVAVSSIAIKSLGWAKNYYRKAQAHHRAVELKHGYRPSSGIDGFSLILAVSIASLSAVAIAVVVCVSQMEPDPWIDALERFRQAND